MSTRRHLQFLGDTQWAILADPRFKGLGAEHLEVIRQVWSSSDGLSVSLEDQSQPPQVPSSGEYNTRWSPEVHAVREVCCNHQHQWAAVVETPFLAIPHAMTDAIQ